MSRTQDSQNVLDNLSNVKIKYVLAAFQYTEDACATDIGPGTGDIGDKFKGKACGGLAYILLNEFKTEYYTIDKFESEFSYYSAIAPTSTQMIGQIRIVDRIGGQFPNFLRKIAGKLNLSQTHFCFVLKTFFIGQTPDGQDETYSGKPLIFNMAFMTNTFSSDSHFFYTMYFLATYNTFGLLPTFSRLYQTTITNVDGNPSTEIPKPDSPSCSIIPRGIEDNTKNPLRKIRIDKSKPMVTLDDVFKGFAEDLQQQKYEHKRQLQEWLSYVRDDHVKKIDAPKQVKSPGYIPIDYRFSLDGSYSDYKVDNRNMPFEQPEQSQEKYGIRVIPIPDGEHLLKAVERLMRLSRQVGKDAQDFIPKTSFKSNIIIIRRCAGKYDLFLNVRNITVPTNTPDGIDTGPGDDAIDPLYFEFQNVDTGDVNIESVNTKMTSLVDLRMMETQVDDPDAEVVFGNREQATAERAAQVDFFKSLYSGVRPNINNQNNGLESAADAGKADNMLTANINNQSNSFVVKIKGNPKLLSDICRNPMKVKDGKIDGAVFYGNPEYKPMYAKTILYLAPPAHSLGLIGDDTDGDTDGRYYYEKYYHLYKINTIIEGDDFSQELTMLRTDDTA